jgi:CheY-like chemotaxis protein
VSAPARILLVEDEAIIALATEARLRAMGHEVVGTAGTGDAAELLAQQVNPDLALMDINIRGDRDGVAVAATLRDTFGIPSVFVTAYGDDATIQRAAGAGPLGYLVKPYEDRDLAAAIEVALHKAASDRKLDAYRRELEETVQQLEEALAKVRTLSGLLPVCAWCKEVRNDDGYWEDVQTYLARHTDVLLSHGICPPCAAKMERQLDDE